VVEAVETDTVGHIAEVVGVVVEVVVEGVAALVVVPVEDAVDGVVVELHEEDSEVKVPAAVVEGAAAYAMDVAVVVAVEEEPVGGDAEAEVVEEDVGVEVVLVPMVLAEEERREAGPEKGKDLNGSVVIDVGAGAVAASKAGGAASMLADTGDTRDERIWALGGDASALGEAVEVPFERHEWAAQVARKEFDGMRW